MQETAPDSNRPDRTRNRALFYAMLALGVIALAILAPQWPLWAGPEIRSSLGTTLSTLAMMAGALALVRYRSRPNDTLLLLCGSPQLRPALRPSQLAGALVADIRRDDVH